MFVAGAEEAMLLRALLQNFCKSQGNSTVRVAGDVTVVTVDFPSAPGFLITSHPYKYYSKGGW